MNTKILIADGLAKDGVTKIQQLPNTEVEFHSALERSKLIPLLSGAHILIVRSRTQVDRELLENAKELKLVLRAGIGLDNVDIAAATEKGIVVMNAPTGNIVTTAEHALALLFAVSRFVPQADQSMRRGEWEKKKFQGREITNKTLGVLGLGNIGKAVAIRAQALQMKVVGYDPYLSKEAAEKYQVELLPLDELLKVSDYVTVHVPLNDKTRNLIDSRAISSMKKGAFLINCARGGIVDEKALLSALDDGRIGGAALDVFEEEPLPKDHPFLTRSNVVLTPHLGASTEEAQVQVSLEVAEQIESYLQTGATKNAVNVPNITSEQLQKLKPYITLCERLGSFTAQLNAGQPIEKLSLKFESIAENAKDREILSLAVIQGFLTQVIGSPVNYVNAKKLLKERGLSLVETYQASCADYSGLVELSLEGATQTVCAGTLFGKSQPRIIRINGFTIDAVASGKLLFTRNIDEPGVIGRLGTALSEAKINIAAMHLGRKRAHGEALALLHVDSLPNDSTLEKIRSLTSMLGVLPIELS